MSACDPTFGDESFAIETHLLDFHPLDVTAQTEVEISFLQWRRPEIKFPSIEALKTQIGEDVRRAQRYFGLLEKRAAHRGGAETWRIQLGTSEGPQRQRFQAPPLCQVFFAPSGYALCVPLHSRLTYRSLRVDFSVLGLCVPSCLRGGLNFKAVRIPSPMASTTLPTILTNNIGTETHAHCGGAGLGAGRL